MATHEYQVNDLEPWQRSHHEAQKEIARLRAERDDLAREVERLRADLVPQWQPIGSAKAGDRCLFFGNTRHDQGIAFSGWVAINGLFYSDTGELVKPTHWKPLDTPPEAD